MLSELIFFIEDMCFSLPTSARAASIESESLMFHGNIPQYSPSFRGGLNLPKIMLVSIFHSKHPFSSLQEKPSHKSTHNKAFVG